MDRKWMTENEKNFKVSKKTVMLTKCSPTMHCLAVILKRLVSREASIAVRAIISSFSLILLLFRSCLEQCKISWSFLGSSWWKPVLVFGSHSTSTIYNYNVTNNKKISGEITWHIYTSWRSSKLQLHAAITDNGFRTRNFSGFSLILF